MRELVETVTVYRDDSRSGGVQVEITDRLNALLGEQAFPNGIRAVGGLMVAEEGFECSYSSSSECTALLSFLVSGGSRVLSPTGIAMMSRARLRVDFSSSLYCRKSSSASCAV